MEITEVDEDSGTLNKAMQQRKGYGKLVSTGTGQFETSDRMCDHAIRIGLLQSWWQPEYKRRFRHNKWARRLGFFFWRKRRSETRMIHQFNGDNWYKSILPAGWVDSMSCTRSLDAKPSSWLGSHVSIVKSWPFPPASVAVPFSIVTWTADLSAVSPFVGLLLIKDSQSVVMIGLDHVEDSETVRCPSLKNGIDNPSENNAEFDLFLKFFFYLRTMIDPKTTNDTIGCRLAASLSSWLWGGIVGSASLETARVDMKIAPTPDLLH